MPAPSEVPDGRVPEALFRTRTGDPFLTILPLRSPGVGRCPTKSLQSTKLCGMDMTRVYTAGLAFLTRKLTRLH